MSTRISRSAFSLVIRAVSFTDHPFAFAINATIFRNSFSTFSQLTKSDSTTMRSSGHFRTFSSVLFHPRKFTTDENPKVHVFTFVLLHADRVVASTPRSRCTSATISARGIFLLSNTALWISDVAFHAVHGYRLVQLSSEIELLRERFELERVIWRCHSVERYRYFI